MNMQEEDLHPRSKASFQVFKHCLKWKSRSFDTIQIANMGVSQLYIVFKHLN